MSDVNDAVEAWHQLLRGYTRVAMHNGYDPSTQTMFVNRNDDGFITSALCVPFIYDPTDWPWPTHTTTRSRALVVILMDKLAWCAEMCVKWVAHDSEDAQELEYGKRFIALVCSLMRVLFTAANVDVQDEDDAHSLMKLLEHVTEPARVTAAQCGVIVDELPSGGVRFTRSSDVFVFTDVLRHEDLLRNVLRHATFDVRSCNVLRCSDAATFTQNLDVKPTMFDASEYHAAADGTLLRRFVDDVDERIPTQEHYVAVIDSRALWAGFLSVGVLSTQQVQHTQTWSDTLTRRDEHGAQTALREVISVTHANEDALRALGDVWIPQFEGVHTSCENTLALRFAFSERVAHNASADVPVRISKICVHLQTTDDQESWRLQRLAQLLHVLPHVWTHGACTLARTGLFGDPYVFFRAPKGSERRTSVESWTTDVQRVLRSLQKGKRFRSRVSKLFMVTLSTQQLVLIAAESARLVTKQDFSALLNAKDATCAKLVSAQILPHERVDTLRLTAEDKEALASALPESAQRIFSRVESRDRMPVTVTLPVITFLRSDALGDIRNAVLPASSTGLHCARLHACSMQLHRFNASTSIGTPTYTRVEMREETFEHDAAHYNELLMRGDCPTLDERILRWYCLVEHDNVTWLVQGIGWPREFPSEKPSKYQSYELPANRDKFSRLVSLDLRSCVDGVASQSLISSTSKV